MKLRNSEPERQGQLHIDDELEFAWLLKRQLGRRDAF
jgi:hypothetical protein